MRIDSVSILAVILTVAGSVPVGNNRKDELNHSGARNYHVRPVDGQMRHTRPHNPRKHEKVRHSHDRVMHQRNKTSPAVQGKPAPYKENMRMVAMAKQDDSLLKDVDLQNGDLGDDMGPDDPNDDEAPTAAVSMPLSAPSASCDCEPSDEPGSNDDSTPNLPDIETSSSVPSSTEPVPLPDSTSVEPDTSLSPSEPTSAPGKPQRDTAPPGQYFGYYQRVELQKQLKNAPTFETQMEILTSYGNRSMVYDFDNPVRASTESTDAGEMANAYGAGFPAASIMESSMSMVHLKPCALIPPHIRPRADETVVMSDGKISTQMHPERGTQMISNDLSKHQLTIFPQGSMHYMFNPTCQDATYFSAFSSNDPGLTTVPAALLAMKDNALLGAFGGSPVSGSHIDSLRQTVPLTVVNSIEQCLAQCGQQRFSKRSLRDVYEHEKGADMVKRSLEAHEDVHRLTKRYDEAYGTGPASDNMTASPLPYNSYDNRNSGQLRFEDFTSEPLHQLDNPSDFEPPYQDQNNIQGDMDDVGPSVSSALDSLDGMREFTGEIGAQVLDTVSNALRGQADDGYDMPAGSISSRARTDVGDGELPDSMDQSIRQTVHTVVKSVLGIDDDEDIIPGYEGVEQPDGRAVSAPYKGLYNGRRRQLTFDQMVLDWLEEVTGGKHSDSHARESLGIRTRVGGNVTRPYGFRDWFRGILQDEMSELQLERDDGTPTYLPTRHGDKKHPYRDDDYPLKYQKYKGGHKSQDDSLLLLKRDGDVDSDAKDELAPGENPTQELMFWDWVPFSDKFHGNDDCYDDNDDDYYYYGCDGYDECDSPRGPHRHSQLTQSDRVGQQQHRKVYNGYGEDDVSYQPMPRASYGGASQLERVGSGYYPEPYYGRLRNTSYGGARPMVRDTYRPAEPYDIYERNPEPVYYRPVAHDDVYYPGVRRTARQPVYYVPRRLNYTSDPYTHMLVARSNLDDDDTKSHYGAAVGMPKNARLSGGRAPDGNRRAQMRPPTSRPSVGEVRDRMNSPGLPSRGSYSNPYDRVPSRNTTYGPIRNSTSSRSRSAQPYIRNSTQYNDGGGHARHSYRTEQYVSRYYDPRSDPRHHHYDWHCDEDHPRYNPNYDPRCDDSHPNYDYRYDPRYYNPRTGACRVCEDDDDDGDNDGNGWSDWFGGHSDDQGWFGDHGDGWFGHRGSGWFGGDEGCDNGDDCWRRRQPYRQHDPCETCDEDYGNHGSWDGGLSRQERMEDWHGEHLQRKRLQQARQSYDHRMHERARDAPYSNRNRTQGRVNPNTRSRGQNGQYSTPRFSMPQNRNAPPPRYGNYSMPMRNTTSRRAAPAPPSRGQRTVNNIDDLNPHFQQRERTGRFERPGMNTTFGPGNERNYNPSMDNRHGTPLERGRVKGREPWWSSRDEDDDNDDDDEDEDYSLTRAQQNTVQDDSKEGPDKASEAIVTEPSSSAAISLEESEAVLAHDKKATNGTQNREALMAPETPLPSEKASQEVKIAQANMRPSGPGQLPREGAAIVV